MGSFGAHALAGSFLFSWGLWTSVQSVRLIHKRRLHGKGYYGHAAFVTSVCGHRLIPLEGILKIFLSIVGMSIEANGFFWENLPMMQHFSMHSFFLLAGVVDLLVFSKAPVPRNIDYVAHSLAFLMEGLLMQFHIHGRSPLDSLLHTLSVYASYACCATVLLEMHFRHSMLAPLTRSFFVMFQGSWFWQMDYILYNPFGESWDENDHDNIMFTVIVASWHMFIIFLMIILIYFNVNQRYTRTERFMSTTMTTSESIGAHPDNACRLAQAGEMNLILKSDSDDDDSQM